MIKALSRILKQDRERMNIPRSVQQVIPVKRIWLDGIWLVGNKYSKCWRFTDINYAIASKDDKTSMFLDYSELLNALDSNATTKITVCNKRMNKQAFEESILLPLQGDQYDGYRKEYNDMFIINASSETSINIFGDLDYIVIHNQEEETQIQVRGRYRDDLDSLYVLNYDCVPYVPAEFMGVKLFTEDKKRLCEALSLRQDDGKKKAWPSTKEALIEDGYTITEGRQNCKRFAIITR